MFIDYNLFGMNFVNVDAVKFRRPLPDSITPLSSSIIGTCACLCLFSCLQCIDAVGWAAGRASGLYKTEWWGAVVVICLERGADLHTAQPMPLPLTVRCFSKIQIGFTFLVLAHPDSPGQRAVCVYVCS